MFLLAGDKFMPDMHLIAQIYGYGLAYEDFKNVVRRAASDKVLRDKSFNIAKNPKQNGH